MKNTVLINRYVATLLGLLEDNFSDSEHDMITNNLKALSDCNEALAKGGELPKEYYEELIDITLYDEELELLCKRYLDDFFDDTTNELPFIARQCYKYLVHKERPSVDTIRFLINRYSDIILA